MGAAFKLLTNVVEEQSIMPQDPRDPRNPPRDPPRPLRAIPREDPLPLDLEEDLVAYLAESRTSIKAAATERFQIKQQLTNLNNLFLLHDQKDEERHREVTGMIKGHEARIVMLEHDAEDTGSWVRTHGGRLIREEKKRKWWSTRIAKIGFRVLEWAVIGGIAWIVAHLGWR